MYGRSSRRDREAQDDELLALESIFDKNVLHISPNNYSGTFNIYVRLNGCSTLKVTARTKVQGKGLAEGGDEYEMIEREVSYLPPIILNFRLPDLYPSKAPPKFHMSCCWLSLKQMSLLCSKLDDLWRKNRGEVILFTWMQFLQDDALTHLEINDTLDLNLVFPIHQHYKCSSHDAKTAHSANKGLRDRHSSKQPREFVRGNPRKPGPYRDTRYHYMFDRRRIFPTSKNIEECLSKILDYDKNHKLNEFKSSIYLCDVCFCQFLGSECFRFEECQHIFCKECVKKYFEELVKQGQVSSLSCLADGCSTQASTTQIKEILSQEYFARYDQLLLALTLDSMGDIIYCARKDCQSPVIKEPDGNVAICPACKFAFCVYCKRSSHGVELCRFKEGEDRKLFEMYSTGSDDTKRALERQYGKRQISHVVDATLAKNWLTQNTKPCPRCKSPIEKRSGCNKMVCWHCQSCFCWICLEIIQDKNPYRHFNAAESACYGQLFQGDEFEDDDDIEDDLFDDGDEDDDEAEDEDDEDFWDMVVGALAGVILV